MLTAVFILLAIATVFIIEDEFFIGLVFAAILALLWYLKQKIVALNTRIQQLESSVAQTPETTIEEVKSDTVVEVEAEIQAPPENQTVAANIPTEDLQSSPLIIESIESIQQEQAEQKPEIPVEPEKPKGPSIFDKLIKAAWHWFTDGNVFVRVGIIILFMGMTFLIRYAISENLIPIELRLAAVSATAIALMIWGWKQRNKRPEFSLLVQGGGIGLLYLTIFAGFSLYHVIPSTMAFLLLALIVILAAVLSILQDAKPLALFATIGGFLAPILTSSGSNNYIGLFSYYTLLNLGIFTIAWFRSWRILNFVGFIFTFAISTIWGVLSYQDIYFSTTEPFLIIFFLLYVAIGILFAHQRTPFYKDYVDSSLVFGTPLLAFGMQAAMVNIYEYGIAISAAILAIFYLLLARILWDKYRERLRLLCETFLSLGVIFATLAIPFAIDGTLTAASWAIEGAGILWISIKQQQKYRRLFGIALIFAAGIMLLSELILPLNEPAPVFAYAFANSAFIGCVIIAIAASASCWLLSCEYDDKLGMETKLGYALLGYGLLVLLAGFEYQIYDFELYRPHGNLLALLCASAFCAYSFAATKLRWRLGHWTALGFTGVLAMAATLSFAYQNQLASSYGYLIWPLSIIAGFYSLKQAADSIKAVFLLSAHVLVSIIIACLLLWDGLWQLLLGYSLLTIAFNYLADRLNWPQLKFCALIFLPVLVITSMLAIARDGNLVSLSAIAGNDGWPFPPGNLLWPFSFSVYFYLLYKNQQLNQKVIRILHYAGGLLIAVMLLWLGLWPLLLGCSLLCLLSCVLWQKLDWAEMRISSLALLPLMLLTAIIKWTSGDSGNTDPFDLQAFHINIDFALETGYLLWPLAFFVLFRSLRQFEKQNQPANHLFYSLGLLLLTALITTEVAWHLLDYVAIGNAWHLAWLPVPSLILVWLVMKQMFWPFNRHYQSLMKYSVMPVLFAALIWSLIQLTSSGFNAPLPWLPLINPLDIMQAILIMAGLWWFRVASSLFELRPGVEVYKKVLMGFIFLWLNVELLRAIHHWEGISWRLPDIVSADISQTSLSILWALCGLLVTRMATTKNDRRLWIYGAVLLGIVVLKLFVIDLDAQETVERIVSFTGVGLLLTAVGYFSPIPPKQTGEANA